MEFVIIGNAVVSLLVLAWVMKIWSRRAATPTTIKAPTQALPAPHEHILVKTWIEGDNYPGIPAWKWECSCGVSGSAGDAKPKTSLGSENNAINRFKDHAQGYKAANADLWKDRHTELERRFAEYKQKCYCKETNDELILLKEGL